MQRNQTKWVKLLIHNTEQPIKKAPLHKPPLPVQNAEWAGQIRERAEIMDDTEGQPASHSQRSTWYDGSLERTKPWQAPRWKSFIHMKKFHVITLGQSELYPDGFLCEKFHRLIEKRSITATSCGPLIVYSSDSTEQHGGVAQQSTTLFKACMSKTLFISTLSDSPCALAPLTNE